MGVVVFEGVGGVVEGFVVRVFLVVVGVCGIGIVFLFGVILKSLF